VVASVGGTGDERELIVAAVGKSEGGLTTDDLCRITGKSPQALGDTLEGLKSSEALLGFAGLWMTPAQFEEESGRFLSALATLHEAEPTKLSQPREKAVQAAKLKWSGKPFDRIVTRLVEDGKLRAQGTNVALAGFKVRFSDRQRELLDRVSAALSRNGVSVPSLADVAQELKVPPQAVEEIVRVGLTAGEFVRIEEGIYVPARLLDETVVKVRELFKDKRFSASEFREALGTTRKYAIPLLEHLDAKNVTKRQGDLRVLA
jgi:selenocysteine-specific elongation factor